MKNFKITIEFDGSRYKGWQNNKDKEQTIQGKIETVLKRMAGEEIEVIGCGRIDVGVHAENYVANFHSDCELSTEAMLLYLYEFLPEDIVVKSLEEVNDRFHAKLNAKSKTYVYKINNNRFRNVFNRRYVYHLDNDLNIDEMRKASEVLVGTHDFQSFTNLKSNGKSTVRTINYINIIEDNGNIDIEINGNDFLLNMERLIIGVLIEVGKGNIKAFGVEKILKDKKRIEAIPMAQGKALVLKGVQYS